MQQDINKCAVTLTIHYQQHAQRGRVQYEACNAVDTTTARSNMEEILQFSVIFLLPLQYIVHVHVTIRVCICDLECKIWKKLSKSGSLN